MIPPPGDIKPYGNYMRVYKRSVECGDFAVVFWRFVKKAVGEHREGR